MSMRVRNKTYLKKQMMVNESMNNCKTTCSPSDRQGAQHDSFTEVRLLACLGIFLSKKFKRQAYYTTVQSREI